MAPVLESASAALGGARNDVSLAGRARRAPRADRPERRRQDDARQPAHRRARADLGRRSRSTAATSRAFAPHLRVRRGIVRTFQINQLFNDLTPLSSLALAVSAQPRHERAAGGGRSAATPPCAAECETPSLERFRLADVMDQPVHSLRLRQAAPARDRDSRWPAGRACCCSTSRSPACPRASARRSSRPSTRCRPTSRSCSSSTTWTWSSTSRDTRHGARQRRRVRRGRRRDDLASDPRVKAVYLGEDEPEARMAELLRVEQLRAGYGEAVVVAGRRLRARRGPVAGAARPQRHRQDDAAQHAGRRDAPARRHASRWPAATSRRCRRTRAPPPASAGCRRSATSSSRSPSTRT